MQDCSSQHTSLHISDHANVKKQSLVAVSLAQQQRSNNATKHNVGLQRNPDNKNHRKLLGTSNCEY